MILILKCLVGRAPDPILPFRPKSFLIYTIKNPANGDDEKSFILHKILGQSAFAKVHFSEGS